MSTRNTLEQIGGTTILFRALAPAPLMASATVTKHEINPLAFTANTATEATSHAKGSSNGEILVP